MITVFGGPAVPRMKASKCDVTTLAAKLKVWLSAKGHYDLQLVMEPIEKWGHSRAMPSAKDIIQFIDLAKIVATVSPNLKLSHRDTYEALLDLHSTHNILPGSNEFCSARKYNGLIRKPFGMVSANCFLQ